MDTAKLERYLRLARASELRQRLLVRDRLLAVAALEAASLGLVHVAAYCRRLILQHNPGHLIGRIASPPDLPDDDALRRLCKQIERRYPLERVEMLLQGLGFAGTATPPADETIDTRLARIMGVTSAELRGDDDLER